MSTLETLESRQQAQAPAPAVRLQPDGPRKGIGHQDLDTAAVSISLIRAVTIHAREIARRYGVTPQQYQAMLEIHCCADPEPITIGGLARRLKIKHNSVVLVINRLSKKGYVVRSPSQHDRRCMHLSLADEGRALLGALVRVDHAESAAILSQLLSGGRRPR